MKDILPMIPGELVSEYRTRVALEQAHADDRRRAELLLEAGEACERLSDAAA